MSVLQSIDIAVQFIKNHYNETPEVGIILGSGLGNFSEVLHVDASINYSDIPYFPLSTVEGHAGKLILGSVGGKRVVAMVGRFHFYEGYKADEVIFPIRVMRALGIHTLMISNAAGGVNPGFSVGQLMILRDHISFATVNPLIGKNYPELGPRFPDMSHPYANDLIEKAKEIAAALGTEVQEGVYFGVTGPTFETRAEYKMIHLLGADAVGMSTVQEVIAACHLGLKVFAISVITDMGIRTEDNIITHDEVLEAAKAAEPKLTAILTRLIAEC
jgi:purine-nucleoside phosphorylase